MIDITITKTLFRSCKPSKVSAEDQDIFALLVISIYFVFVNPFTAYTLINVPSAGRSKFIACK